MDNRSSSLGLVEKPTIGNDDQEMMEDESVDLSSLSDAQNQQLIATQK